MHASSEATCLAPDLLAGSSWTKSAHPGPEQWSSMRDNFVLYPRLSGNVWGPF